MTSPPDTPLAATWRALVHGPTFDDLEWCLSPEVYDLHGLPRDTSLTPHEIMVRGLAATDPEVLARCRDALWAGRGFAHRRRLAREGMDDQDVVVVLAGTYDDEGVLVAVDGVMIDAEGPVQEFVSAEVTAQLRDVVAARATIEQAKGAVMTVYGLTDDAAFALLGWYSQITNTRVRVLADRVAEAAVDAVRDPHGVDAHLAKALNGQDIPVATDGPGWEPGLPEPQVTTRRVEGHTVISVRGAVDVASTQLLATSLRDAFAQVERPQRVHVLDLTGTGHVGPSGIVAIAGQVHKHVASGAELRILPGRLGEHLVRAGVPASLLA